MDFDFRTMDVEEAAEQIRYVYSYGEWRKYSGNLYPGGRGGKAGSIHSDSCIIKNSHN